MLSAVLDSYPRFQPGVALHVTPTATTMSRPREHFWAPEEQRELSGDCRPLLAMCDGLRTAEDVISEAAGAVAADVDAELFALSSLHLLYDLAALGFVELGERPDRRPPRVTGSVHEEIPQHVVLELTDKCNLNCEHCYRDSAPDRNDTLPYDEFLTIATDLSQAGVRYVELTGGEAMVHPRFWDILAVCAESFELIALLTNGTRINERNVDRFLAYSDRLAFSISLDGASARTHDEFRKLSGAFVRTTRAIKLVAERGFFVNVSMSIFDKNYTEIYDVFRLAKSLGASQFACAEVLPFGRGVTSPGLLNPDIARTVVDTKMRIHQEDPEFYLMLDERRMKHIKKAPNCGAGWRSMVISPHGAVRPCVLQPEIELKLGSLRDDPLTDLVNTSTPRRMSNLAAPGPATCSGCPNQFYCQGCMARSMGLNKGAAQHCSWFRTNQVCELMEWGRKYDRAKVCCRERMTEAWRPGVPPMDRQMRPVVWTDPADPENDRPGLPAAVGGCGSGCGSGCGTGGASGVSSPAGDRRSLPLLLGGTGRTGASSGCGACG